MSQPTAKVILDSISPMGDRLVTVEAKIHRFVLAELNTHRMFSRNSASSRAIPIEKMIARVMTDPALPMEWGSNKPGMQAGAPLSDTDIQLATGMWLRARDLAVNQASALNELGLHKQVANRLLEPFMWHTVIITATEWENFFSLRCHPDAQPEMRYAAEAIRDAIAASTPKFLDYGEWHTPYIQEDEYGTLELVPRLKVSAGRCARVSHLTQDGIRDTKLDVGLFDRLTSSVPMHSSPLEHVATPDPPRLDFGTTLGNFQGYRQLRHSMGVLTN